jgi:hypothetical protein
MMAVMMIRAEPVFVTTPAPNPGERALPVSPPQGAINRWR